VRALLRRASGRPAPVIEHGPLAIDPATREVKLRGAPVVLSAKEYALVAALTERPGIVLSRAQLEERLYGWGEEVASNAVEVHIHNLRRKLGDDTIRNVRGVGYTIPAGR
jgi:two-component system response regulator QseB